MRHLLLSVPFVMTLAVLGPACVGADEPAAESFIEPSASNAFVVRLTANASKEDVIQQIVETGQDQLAAACEVKPGTSIRVFNPLASGSYEDVSCESILGSQEPTGQTGEALTSGGENIGQVQQKLTPIGLGCSVVMFGLGIFMNHAICQYPGAENPRACAALAEFGMGGLGVICAFI